MKELKTIDIKGKPYVMVHERIRAFREAEEFKGCKIVTEIVDLQDHRVIFKATISDGANNILATGHAFEYSDGGQINKTSFVENCETSAIGRALGNLGIGVQESFATAEEVATAIHQQKEERPWLKEKEFELAVKRIQEAKSDIELKDGDDELTLTPSMFVEWLKKKYRMKREYSEQLGYEVEFQLTLSK